MKVSVLNWRIYLKKTLLNKWIKIIRRIEDENKENEKKYSKIKDFKSVYSNFIDKNIQLEVWLYWGEKNKYGHQWPNLYLNQEIEQMKEDESSEEYSNDSSYISN